jgi:hypothetical protein
MLFENIILGGPVLETKTAVKAHDPVADSSIEKASLSQNLGFLS